MKKNKDEVEKKEKEADPTEKYSNCKRRAEEYLRGWQRSRADFENFKKRYQKEKSESIKYANKDLILQILPVLDNLESALVHVPKDLAESEWVKGFEFILKHFKDILVQNNVKPIEALEKKFDPHLHEAVETQKGKKGIVIKEVAKGYMIGDKIIRPSKVIIGI